MKVKKIICHITASNPNATLADIEAGHKARGFKQIGYHFLIDSKGNLLKGRPENIPGAHCEGQNSDSIGISYIARGSDTDSKGEYGKYMTDAQKEPYIKLIASLVNKYKLTIDDVYPHNYFNKNKSCPCFQIDDEVKKLIKVELDKLKAPKEDPPELAEAVDGEDYDDDFEPKKATRSKD